MLGPLAVGLATVLTLSVVVVFFAVFALGLSGIQEQRSQHLLYSSFRGVLDPASPVAPPVGGAIPSGSAVALLNSSAAGMANVVVVQGSTSSDLLAGPGHLPTSPLPGQDGDAVLVGKSLTAGAPFAHVAGLRNGSTILIRTGQGRFVFTVIDHRLAGERAPIVRANKAYLTLVTSSGPGEGTRFPPTEVVYVDAALRGRPASTPRGPVRSSAYAEVPGHNDPNALPYAAAIFGLLVGAVVLTWYLWRRWGLLRTWLVGAPVLFAILWALSNQLMRLLPNVT